MFSGLIPGINSVNWLEDELSGHIPANLITLLDHGSNSTLFTHSVVFLRREWWELILPPNWRTEVLWIVIIVTVALLALSWYLGEDDRGDTVAMPADRLIRDALFDAPGLGPPESFCEICMEEKHICQMFKTESCSHSFCNDCTSNHIAAKIQDNIITILCPGLNCKAPLDFDACRLIIPKDVIVRWDEWLCKSLIPESQIVYCPFKDCSAMLVNDFEEIIEKTECPACKRSICARCRAPWHSEFTCEEFHWFDGKEGKEDAMVEELAKKKSWRKCPHCKFYVEKTQGCLHITCRCGYEFCYRCGDKWAKSHGDCQGGQEEFLPPTPTPNPNPNPNPNRNRYRSPTPPPTTSSSDFDYFFVHSPPRSPPLSPPRWDYSPSTSHRDIDDLYPPPPPPPPPFRSHLPLSPFH